MNAIIIIIISTLAVISFFLTFEELKLENKGNLWIRAFISLCTSVIVSILTTFVCNGIDDIVNKKEPTKIEEETEIYGEEQVVNTGGEVEYSELKYIDNIEDEVAKIQSIYYPVRKNIDNNYYEVKEYEGGLKSYFDVNGKLVVMEIPNGYDEVYYSRIYYYQEDNLYFAFVFNGDKEENRMYFKNGILFRYKDENDVEHDKSDGVEDCPFYDLVTCESKEMLSIYGM